MDTTPTTTSATADYATDIMSNPLYDRDQRDILLWFAGHLGQDSISLAKAGELIGRSGTVVQRVLRGSYQADPTGIIADIARYKAVYDARQTIGNACPYVHTAMAKRIWEAADYALHRKQIVNLIGKTQRGKTTAIKEYARTHGVMVLYVRCPVAPTPIRLAKRIAAQLGLRSRGSMDICMDYIIRNITPQHLIVIDEIHQIVLQERGTGIRSVEALREIADEGECGMILIGTNVWCDALNRDISWRGVLDQIVKRGMTVALKDQLPISDLRLIWQQYHLPDPIGDTLATIKQLAAEHGLGRYTKLLSIGYTIASKAGQPYDWEHWLKAVSVLDALADGQ